MPVFALYNLNDAGTVAADSAMGNGAQNGSYINGAASDGQQAVLDGVNDLVKIYTDPTFQLDRGTLAIDCSLSGEPLTSTQTLLSRDSIGDTAGGFRIEILADGSVVISHETGTGTETFGTAPGFAAPNDQISLSYSWDQGGTGGTLSIRNVTDGATFTESVPATLTMDMGDISQPWIIGAGQSLSNPLQLNDINQHFSGNVTTFSLSDTVDNDPENDAPTANPDAISTLTGVPVTIPVLANDTDPNGDALTLLGVPVSADGTVTVNPDGTIEFTPTPGFTGTTTITYTITDGNGGTDSGEVTVTVNDGDPARDGIVRGTTGGDLIDFAYTGDNDGDFVDASDAILTGDAPNDDRILAGGGNDTIRAGAGDDSVEGGTGDDSATGGLGDDSIWGQGGDDTLLGGVGNDSLIGGNGSDSVQGGDGNDVIDTSGGGAAPLPDLGYAGVYASDAAPLNDLDTVYGGGGNDTITTGDDADVIFGGLGNDLIDGGFDADTISGNQGDDTIIGAEGSDLIDAGWGNDVVYGGYGPDVPDAVNILDATDLRPENGRDSIRGGLGDDTLFGQDDDDTLDGGQGNDVINAGIDDDLAHGGAGNDVLTGGQGVDTLYGDGDRDTFVVNTASDGAGDAVYGGAAGDDFDTLDLTGSGLHRLTNVTTDSDGNGIDGTVEFLDTDGNVTGSLNFTNIEEVIPCFTPGTLIATPKGEVPVESLRAGDRIITRDNGIQEIRWTGQKAMSRADLAANPHLKPVLIRQGSLGNGLPERDMMVSPNHRMLVANDRTALYFDEHEVLVSAKHLITSAGVQTVDSLGTTYIHFMFDRHEVVLSNGAWTESFQPGDFTLKGMGNAQRGEIFDLFPELQTEAGLQDYTAARRTLKRHEAVLLAR